MKMHLIEASGAVDHREVGDISKLDLNTIVGGFAELVNVIYNGKPATLVVNENGAVGPRLPINARATAIYWTATIQGYTGVQFNPLEDPMIHGPAVLLEIDKRKL